MNGSRNALLTGVYTLTPTHCGTGQTSGAVDLPIARESHTNLPILPATSLKGVAREEFKRDLHQTRLFGPALDGAELSAGELIVPEGKLLLFPLRSLNRPFFYATCWLILERLARDLRALGLTEVLSPGWPNPSTASQSVLVVDERLQGQPLIIEDLVYDAKEVAVLPSADALVTLLQSLLPPEEATTRDRLSRSLIVLPDNDFLDAVQRCTPVQARIKLTSHKTTGKAKGEDGKEESGNLWYEETLPSDCLFTVLVSQRAQTTAGGSRSPLVTGDTGQPAVEVFDAHRRSHANVQIGGNETVGYGRCWWVPFQSSAGVEK